MSLVLLAAVLWLCRGKCWWRFGRRWLVGWPAAEAEYGAVPDFSQDVVYSCKLVLQVGQKSCWQCSVCWLSMLLYTYI